MNGRSRLRWCIWLTDLAKWIGWGSELLESYEVAKILGWTRWTTSEEWERGRCDLSCFLETWERSTAARAQYMDYYLEKRE